MNERISQFARGGRLCKDRAVCLPLRAARICAVIALFILLTPWIALAQEVEILLPEKECQVKYALLYSFGLLTTWPSDSFDAKRGDTFVIGVLGDKPFPDYLARIAASKKIQGCSIVIQRFKAPEDVGLCHILYVTEAVPVEGEQVIVKKLAGRPVMIVSERSAGAADNPATIQFVIEQGAVKFALNTAAAKAGKLQIDPRLLKLAKRTSTSKP